MLNSYSNCPTHINVSVNCASASHWDKHNSWTLNLLYLVANKLVATLLCIPLGVWDYMETGHVLELIKWTHAQPWHACNAPNLKSEKKVVITFLMISQLTMYHNKIVHVHWYKLGGLKIHKNDIVPKTSFIIFWLKEFW